MLFRYTIGALIAASACVAQNSTQPPCAQASSLLTNSKYVPAAIAEACLESAPINKNDALLIIDGVIAMLNLQSTEAWLKSPPSTYPFPAIDQVTQLTTLRSQVSSGNMSSEIAFERRVYQILGQAYDGHLLYLFDGMGVFSFLNPFGDVAIVSLDGKQTPAVYAYDELYAYAEGTGKAPSAIVSINGVNATSYIMSQISSAASTGFQDLDALFNQFPLGPMYPPGVTNQGSYGLASGLRGIYLGNSTTYAFANGTTRSLANVAYTNFDFTGVNSGAAFTRAFCSTTGSSNNKRDAADILPARRHLTPGRELNKRDFTARANGPTLVVNTSDGAVAGYFLNAQGYTDTAVLVIPTFEPESEEDFQAAVYYFLQQCQKQQMKHLVIDITGNGGGYIALGYDTFKQLFPNIYPYGAGQVRDNDAFQLIVSNITSEVQQVEKAEPNNVTAYDYAGGPTDYNALVFLNDSGAEITSFSEYYGPVTAKGDSFTNLFRIDVTDANYNGLAISGYGGPTLGKSIFSPQNIVILGDGQCSSTCTIFSHLMKWQGKVKSIAVGGRLQTGPMQSQGGVKGSEVKVISSFIGGLGELLTDAQYTALENTKSAGALFKNYETMLQRTRTGTLYSNNTDLSFNYKNAIAEGDSTYTPLQFVYEAADCRFWYTPSFLVDVSTEWMYAASNAFGLKNTTQWSGCVSGSTGATSSLSGNSALYANGVPNNVTTFTKEGTNGSGTNSTGKMIRRWVA